MFPDGFAGIEIEADEGVFVRAVIASGVGSLSDDSKGAEPFAKPGFPEDGRAIGRPLRVPSDLRRGAVAQRPLVARPVGLGGGGFGFFGRG